LTVRLVAKYLCRQFSAPRLKCLAREIAGLISVVAALLFFALLTLHAQTVFVDAFHGRDDAHGTKREPVATLQRAGEIASGFTGDLPITIKILPGLYSLSSKLALRTANTSSASADYTLEATVMPDDLAWQPWKMPVIQSVSENNSTTQFKHSVGILVAGNNVPFSGVKFVGNPNPNVEYYLSHHTGERKPNRT
jgi:hypothetical protein